MNFLNHANNNTPLYLSRQCCLDKQKEQDCCLECTEECATQVIPCEVMEELRHHDGFIRLTIQMKTLIFQRCHHRCLASPGS
jgi:hypothetical protein